MIPVQLVSWKTRNLVYHSTLSNHLMPLLPSHGSSLCTQELQGSLGPFLRLCFINRPRNSWKRSCLNSYERGLSRVCYTSPRRDREGRVKGVELMPKIGKGISITRNFL